MNKVIKIISYITGSVAGFFFLISVYYASVSPKTDMSETTEVTTNSGLGWLFFSYFIMLFAIALYTDALPIKVPPFKDISLYSFYTYGLFIPFSIITAILTIRLNFITIPTFFVQLACWGIQAFFIAIWFFPKLKQLIKQEASKERDVSMMKLDYYSTFAILLLTIVWVVYDIMSIKIGFAIVMGEFLLVQMLIKKKQINELEKQLIRVKR